MAYMNQERKKEINAELKPFMKAWGVKYTLAVRNHSTLTVNIKSSPIDFLAGRSDRNRGDIAETRMARGCFDVNPYSFETQYEGKALKFLNGLFTIINRGNFDHSDSQSDYFHVGWYVNVNVGQWNKPYILTEGTLPDPSPVVSEVLTADEQPAEEQPVTKDEVDFVDFIMGNRRAA